MKNNKQKYTLLSLLLLATLGIAASVWLQDSFVQLPHEPAQTHMEEKKTEEMVLRQDRKEKHKEIITETEALPPILRYNAQEKEGIIGLFENRTFDNPSDNIFTVNLDELPELSDKVWLTYELEGVKDYTQIPRSINDRLATGGYTVQFAQGKSLQKEQINPAWLTRENRIQFSIPEKADWGYRISGLAIEIEKGQSIDPLVITAPLVVCDNLLYIKGYLQTKDTASTEVKINHSPIELNEGEFELVYSIKEKASLTLTAVFADGNTQTMPLRYTFGEKANLTYQREDMPGFIRSNFQAGTEGELALKNARLALSENSLKEDKEFTLNSLRHIDLPALGMGLHNLTLEDKGFRFLPHGEHFEEYATITMAYDPLKIPSGFSEEDIRTYYFDNESKAWKALEKIKLDRENRLVISKTTHFTDFINGVIQAPESPETNAFVPTQMSGLDVADPTSKIQLLAAPKANSTGTATMSYAFETPPARNGMSPNVGIQYNSDGGSGWLGEGWDVPIQSIKIDTRWGVPRYDEALETETYSFDGLMLATFDSEGNSSVAHRGDRIARSSDRRFYPRQQSNFEKIIRKGNSPANYTWEVTDRSGTVYTYAATLQGTVTTLEGATKTVAAEWYLSRIQELHGDYIEFVYEKLSEPVVGTLTSQAIYLKEVRAGNSGSNPHTAILFSSTTPKAKQTNHARYGFLASSNKLLDEVIVNFENRMLRKYTFTYKEGAFSGNLLTKFTHVDASGNDFASHSFDYYDDVLYSEGYAPFKAEPEVWNLHNDNISANFTNPLTGLSGFSDKATALGGIQSSTTSTSFYTGIGPYLGDPFKGLTAGGSYGYSSNSSEGLSTLIDINGDRLPDKVFREGGALYYRPNIAASAEDIPVYGDKIRIMGINSFSRAKSTSNNTGFSAYIGYLWATANVGTESNKTTSNTTVYFADVNNDGLVDLIMGDRVYFNHIEYDASGNPVPTFTLSSSDTPSPILGGGIIDSSDTEVDPEEQAELVRLSPMLDAVRVWEAPFNGTINITGQVQLVLPTGNYDEDEYAKSDGVRVAVQVRNSEVWSRSIGKGDTALYTASASGISVVKGDKVYFRIQSGNEELSNGAFDVVNWNQRITFTDKTTETNPDGQSTTIYNSSEATIVSLDDLTRLNAPVNAEVSGTFTKPITSDDLTLRIYLSNDPVDQQGNTNPSYQQLLVYERMFPWNEEFNGVIETSIENTLQGENLRFEINSETNVAWENVTWQPEITYKDEKGNPYQLVPVIHYSLFAGQEKQGSSYQTQAAGTVSIQPLLLTRDTVPLTSGRVLMSVKKVKGLIAKQEFTLSASGSQPSHLQTSFPNEKVWIEFYTEDTNILTNAAFYKAIIADEAKSDTIDVNVFTTRSVDGFGPMYRGWGQFTYNAAENRYGSPINQSLLALPTDENAQLDPLTTAFFPMTPDPETKTYWIGPNRDVYIKGDQLSATRLGEKDVVLTNPLENLPGTGDPSGNCLPGSGTVGIQLQTKSNSRSTLTGGLGITYSNAGGDSRTTLSYVDMNGDGYPDIVSENQIQFTNPTGGFDGEILRGISNQKGESKSSSWGFGGAAIHAYNIVSTPGNYSISNSTKNEAGKNSRGNKEAKLSVEVGRNQPTATITIPSTNEDWNVETFIDVNGDGLPDKILSNKQVQFNLGYSFSSPVDIGLTEIQKGETKTVNAGLGYDFGASSISAGFGLTTSSTDTDYMLLDVNADGLADKVRVSGDQVYVSLNKGNGFAPEIAWNGAQWINNSASTSESLNAGSTFTVIIPIPFFPLKVPINVGASTGNSLGRSISEIRDVDGTGNPALVYSEDDGSMSVWRSTIQRTNMLSKVVGPLGAEFMIDYERTPATYNHPSGKWVMKSVEVDDGIKDDGSNILTTFDYNEGVYERNEREFLGFGTVTAREIDTEATTALQPYRSIVQKYDVSDYYKQGNLLEAFVEDGAGNLFTKTINEYYAYRVKGSGNNLNLTEGTVTCDDRAIVYAPLKYSRDELYEGSVAGITLTESYYQYNLVDHPGFVSSFYYSDKGTLGNQGNGEYNYRTSIEYTGNPAKHIFGLPSRTRVTGVDGTLYRQTDAQYDLNYSTHLTQVSRSIDQTAASITNYTYDTAGNITQVTLPANTKGERMYYRYSYDRDYNMYIERVDDAYGYRSEMEDYDYRYGIPRTIIDINGYVQETTLDNLGRITSYTGPNELAEGIPYTIKYEYVTTVQKDATGITSPAHVITNHYDPQHPGNDMQTVSFVDGIGRTIQVKKDGVITTVDENGTNPVEQEVMLISGRVRYDAFGRTIQSYYPTYEPIGTPGLFNRGYDTVTPTLSTFDILDRQTSELLPDSSLTVMEYLLDKQTNLQVTKITDAMGGQMATFTNGYGMNVKTEMYSGPDGTITTNRFYDPIYQLTKTVDTYGNEYTYQYDMQGRTLSKTSPASGTTRYTYDTAGNVTSSQTQNLAEVDKKIEYGYEYMRLVSVNYPEHPQNNVTYTYGNRNSSHNRVGKIALQEDGSGAQEFYYGRLGELIEVRRTVIIPNQAVATYVTKTAYDTWNRITEIIYPDEEKVNYYYNTGGLLDNVTGLKAYSYNYVPKIGYDKFEQRIYMQYCNGAETVYEYDPLRHRLENLKVWAGQTQREQIIDNRYQFDKVNNILSVENSAPAGMSGIGGQMEHRYTYDGLYRLTEAEGIFSGVQNRASYHQSLAYDNIYRITSKQQFVEQTNVSFTGTLEAGYNLNYNYSATNPHQLSTLSDISFRNEATHQSSEVDKMKAYEYDANGNLVYINMGILNAEGIRNELKNERKLIWDEENRLEAISDDGYVSNYWYDADGQRVVKTYGENQEIYVNSIFSGGTTGTANFAAYINPFLVVTKGGNYTKHIYINDDRIVSKLGDLDSYGADPRRIEYAGHQVPGITVDYDSKYKQSLQIIKDRYNTLDVPYYGIDNDDYVNGGGFCCDNRIEKLLAALPESRANDNPELFQFYYHKDHLGSSSLITNLDGDIVQHIEYLPFGEIFLEQRNNTWNSPYLFNGKELDEETGLYYYGARYYDPRSSIWLSVDPLGEKYPGISVYAYTFQNPVRFVDPLGLEGEEAETGSPWYFKLHVGTRAHSLLTSYLRRVYMKDAIWKADLSIGGKELLARPDIFYYDGYVGGTWELKPAPPAPSAALAAKEASEYAKLANKFYMTDVIKPGTSGGAPLPFLSPLLLFSKESGELFVYTIPTPSNGAVFYTRFVLPRDPVAVPAPDLSPRPYFPLLPAVVGTAKAVGNWVPQAASRLVLPIFFIPEWYTWDYGENMDQDRVN